MIDHNEKITTKLEQSDTHTSYSYKICKELENRLETAEREYEMDGISDNDKLFFEGVYEAYTAFYIYLKNLLLGETK